MPKRSSNKNLAPTDYERGFERGVVTFIDILGYRNLLRTRTADEIVQVVKALREFTAGDTESDDLDEAGDEPRQFTQSFSESVSDAVVRVRTIDTEWPDGPFVYELIDLMHAIVECVNQGILVRGGMTIGPVHVGTNGKGPIFGPAMVRAYEIEQNEAVYPRIMIDDGALEAYISDKSLWQDGDFDQDEAKIALNFVAISEDGSYFIDYLRAAGPGEFDGGVAGQFKFLQQHQKLIIENKSTADDKSIRKLTWLANYHNRFISELRNYYDMEDKNGDFELEVGVKPKDLFDSLIIKESGRDILVALEKISNGQAKIR